MSHMRSPAATLREKSSWTPKNYPPSNEKIFRERITLIKKWYAAWNESQRWTLLEFVLKQLRDDQLTLVHELLHPVIPTPDHDFTRVLPRYVCLRIFSLLDPQSLCRAAQVSWYWKYLAECNEIWQVKCLKLGWFLLTPPHEYDSTVWKRHYIACVCQLHWHPPQAPSDESDDEDVDGLNELDQEELLRTRRKKHLFPRHSSANEPKRPWRDPDRHPKDIHFQYSDMWTSITSGLPITTQSVLEGDRLNSEGRPQSPSLNDSTAIQFPPPSSILHPTLLEKMRLGSPSLAHKHLSTLNSLQSNEAISETLYELQDTAPFPRLPPYYVHDTSGMDMSTSYVQESGQHKKHSKNSNRPPSGRSGVSTQSMRRSVSSGRSSPQSVRDVRKSHSSFPIPTKSQRKVVPAIINGKVKDNTESNGLRSQPWSIPDDEEDDG